MADEGPMPLPTRARSLARAPFRSNRVCDQGVRSTYKTNVRHLCSPHLKRRIRVGKATDPLSHHDDVGRAAQSRHGGTT